MKKLFLMLLLISPCFGISTDSNSYSKGDSIIVGVSNLSNGLSYVINAYAGNDLVFMHNFVATGSDYSFTYETSFLDPSGDWLVSLDNDVKLITVNPSRDSSSYLVSFISPVSRGYERTELINLTVNISQAGESVENAVVHSFDDSGNRIILTEFGSGVYSSGYKLAVNSVTGVRSLTVLALKDSLGGQGVINITVNEARISLTIVQPELSEYSIGSLLTIKVKGEYPNGSVQGFNVNASYGEVNIPLNFSDGFYVGEYKLTPADDGLKTLMISAFDVYDNGGTVSKKISGSNLFVYYLVSNIWYIIIGGFGVGVAVFFAKKKISSTIDVKKLTEKKKELFSKKKRLQEDYFVNNAISKDIYEDDTSKIDEELNIINSKLKDINKK